MRSLYRQVCLFALFLVAGVPQAQEGLSRLLDDLTKPQSTTHAASLLISMGESQPSVVSALSDVLPNLLLTSTDVEVVQSEARLAGNLRLSSTIPALIQLLDRPNQLEGIRTFTRDAELYDDPVGRALADIGAPSVDALMAPLESAKASTRTRAARVLVRINTGETRSLLRQRLERETDNELKRYIAANLRSPGV